MSSKKQPLFDQMKLMFQNPKEFAKLTNYEKGKYFFMFNRFFAIKYPINANLLNKTKIPPGEAVQVWSDLLTKVYNRIPQWIWSGIKGVKNKKEETKKNKIEPETILFYAQKHQISTKEVEYALKTIGPEFEQELLKIQKLLKN